MARFDTRSGEGPWTTHCGTTVACLLGLGLTLASTMGCDALVGGACADGFQPNGTQCVPIPDHDPEIHAGGGGEGGFDPGDPVGGGGTAGTGGGAPGGNGAGGSLVCEPPMTPCPVGCVDLDKDFSNCGACGVHCPTELCIDGQCAGDPVGHTVVIGMSFAESSASTRRLLGNAVFRPLHSPLHIVDYREHASGVATLQVEAAIASEASLRGRNYSLDTVATGDLVATLQAGSADVVLVHDQSLASGGTLTALGNAVATAMDSFLAEGGTLVVLASNSGTGKMCNFLGKSHALECTGFTPIYDQPVLNALPSDTVGNGVGSPLLAKPATAAILTKEGPDSSVAHVFTDPWSDPVVIHKVTGP